MSRCLKSSVLCSAARADTFKTTIAGQRDQTQRMADSVIFPVGFFQAGMYFVDAPYEVLSD